MKTTKLQINRGFQRIIFTFIILLISICASSQSSSSVQSRLNQLKANKIAFLTQQMKLTPDEAQVFWPIYNEFAAKKEELNKIQKELAKKALAEQMELSNSQKEDIADKLIANRVDQANLDAEYHQKFKSVLPISKVLKLYQSENQFKSELIRQLKDQQIKLQESSNQQRRKN